MNHGHDTNPAPAAWRHASLDACLAALVAECSLPMGDWAGIDGEGSADRVAQAVFGACRAGVEPACMEPACMVLADWLHDAALAAIREHGRENGLPVWECAGFPLAADHGPFLP